jgi:hypothetical protein
VNDVVLSWETQYLQKALETDAKQNELLLVFPFFPETIPDMEFSDPASKNMQYHSSGSQYPHLRITEQNA